MEKHSVPVVAVEACDDEDDGGLLDSSKFQPNDPGDKIRSE